VADDEDQDDVFATSTQLACCAFAGGSAGSLQHAVSYHTEEVLQLESGLSKKLIARHFRELPLPPLRGTLFAAIPSAIGFVAYEYGREFSEKA